MTLGCPKRETDMFSILPTIFRSGKISVAKKLIWDAEKDADQVFWWIENNIPIEFTDSKDMQVAYDTLSRADVFRGYVSKKQNWRFKSYMVDLMSSISVGRKAEPPRGWIKYEPPQKIIMMAANKNEKAELKDLYEKIGD